MSRSIHRRFGACSVAVLMAATFAGCGGDSGRAEVPSTATTTNADYASGRLLATTPEVATVTQRARRAYIAKVDDVCKRLDGKRESARERAAAGSESGEGARAYDDTITLGERQLRAIKAIAPPPGESRLLRSNVYDVLDRQLAVRREMHTALGDSDIARLRALRVQLDSLTQSLLGFARGYGFQVCGED